MPVKTDTLSILTEPKSLQMLTQTVTRLVQKSGVKNGLCTVFVPHTSASLLIQENADPDVLEDLLDYFSELVPENRHYRHSAEGSDDMPAHLRTTLTQSSIGIPIVHGHLALGTWQGIYLFEHRAHRHNRQVVVQCLGVKDEAGGQ